MEKKSKCKLHNEKLKDEREIRDRVPRYQIMNTRADGWLGNGKELEFKDQVGKIMPAIMGKSQTKLSKEIESPEFLLWEVQCQGEREGRMALLVR